MLGLAAWLIYGLLSGDAPLVAANAVTMVLAGGILFDEAEYTADGNSSKTTPCTVAGAARGGHSILPNLT